MKNQLQKLTSPARLAAVALVAMSLGTAHAQNFLWSNAPANANWSGASNWTNGSAPVGGSTLEFTNSSIAALTNDIAAGTSFAGITFDLNAATYIFANTGNAIVLTGGITNKSTATETINLAITNNTAGLVITNTTTGTLAFGGAIAGTGSFIVGGGTVNLTGNNNYSGGITLNTGTILVGNNNALGTGTLTLNGGTLGNNAGTIANNINVVGSAGVSVTNSTFSGNLLGAGTMTYNAPASPATLTLSGSNNGFNGLFIQANSANTALAFTTTNSGSANATWQFNNTTVSRTRMQFGNGTISLGSITGNGIINNNGTAGTAIMRIGDLNTNSTFSGSIQQTGTGSLGLTKVGTGTLTLSGANTYNGATTVSGGTMAAGNASAFGTGTVTLSGGNLQFASAVTITNNINASSNAIIDQNGLNGGLSGNITGSGTLSLGGTLATMTLGGTNSGYTGTFTQGSANAVSFTNANAGSAAAAWVFNDGNADRIRLNFGSGTISFGSLSGVGQIQADTAGVATVSVGALNTSTTFNGTLKDNTGTIALTKVGTGTQTLSGANTYSGGTTVSAGTLIAANTNALGTGLVSVNGGVLALTTNVTVSKNFTIAGGSFDNAGKILNVGTNNFTMSSGTLFDNLTSSIATGSGAATFTISGGFLDLTGATINYGNTYALFNSFSVSSSFVASIMGYDTNNFLASVDNTGMLSFAAVPEPSTWVLFGLSGLVMVVAFRRRVS